MCCFCVEFGRQAGIVEAMGGGEAVLAHQPHHILRHDRRSRSLLGDNSNGRPLTEEVYSRLLLIDPRPTVYHLPPNSQQWRIRRSR